MMTVLENVLGLRPSDAFLKHFSSSPLLPKHKGVLLKGVAAAAAAAAAVVIDVDTSLLFFFFPKNPERGEGEQERSSSL